MKVVIIGDMHRGVRGNDRHMEAFQFNWFEGVLKYMKANELTQIIQVGDVWDKRKATDTYILERTVQMFERASDRGITVHKIVGNHDIYFRDSNDITPDNVLLRILGPNYRVYRNASIASIGGHQVLMCGWMNKENTEETLKLIDRCSNDPNTKYCFGHFEPRDMAMYRGIVAKEGLDPSIFAGFDRVVMGHYHTVSRYMNIDCVGSPYHLTWADYGDDRGFFVLDLDTNEMEFIKNDPSQSMFLEFEYDPDTKYSPEMFTGGDGMSARILINDKPNKKHFKAFVELLEQAPFRDYRIIDNVEVSVKVDDVAPIDTTKLADTNSIINAYVQGTSLDDDTKGTIAQYICGLYVKAHENKGSV